nr:hypothetical protein LKV13_04955 [Borrelia sp. BU AG58]
MKKINIIFYLILAVLLASCDLLKMGGQSRDGNKTGAGGKTTLGTGQTLGGKTEKEAQAETATPEEIALTVIKGKRDDYKKRVDGLKAAFDALGATAKQEVRIPAEVTGFEDTDRDKIHSSLDYDNETIKNLNESINALKLSENGTGGKIDTVTGVLALLDTLGIMTNKILNERLKDENLEKIKNDKTKLEKAEEGLDEFIAARDGFINKVKEIVATAVSKKNGADAVAEELDNINRAYIEQPNAYGYHQRVTWSAYRLDKLIKQQS